MIRKGSRVKRKIVLENGRDRIGHVTRVDGVTATVEWDGILPAIERVALSSLRLAAFGER